MSGEKRAMTDTEKLRRQVGINQNLREDIDRLKKEKPDRSMSDIQRISDLEEEIHLLKSESIDESLWMDKQEHWIEVNKLKAEIAGLKLPQVPVFDSPERVTPIPTGFKLSEPKLSDPQVVLEMAKNVMSANDMILLKEKGII